MPVESGKYRDRVLLMPPGAQRRYESGQVEDVPSAGFRVWAWVRQVSGTELIRASQQVSQATYLVRIRWFPGIDTSWQVEHRGRILEIGSAVDLDELHEEYELSCVWEG